MARKEPHRLWWILIAATPLLWMPQGALGWYVAGRACPSAAEPLSFTTSRIIIVALAVAALAWTAVALVFSGRVARLRDGAAPEAVIERRRFVAKLGLVTTVTLALGLVFAALPAAVLHMCGEAR